VISSVATQRQTILLLCTSSRVGATGERRCQSSALWRLPMCPPKAHTACRCAPLRHNSGRRGHSVTASVRILRLPHAPPTSAKLRWKLLRLYSMRQGQAQRHRQTESMDLCRVRNRAFRRPALWPYFSVELRVMEMCNLGRKRRPCEWKGSGFQHLKDLPEQRGRTGCVRFFSVLCRRKSSVKQRRTLLRQKDLRP